MGEGHENLESGNSRGKQIKFSNAIDIFFKYEIGVLAHLTNKTLLDIFMTTCITN